MSISLDKVPVTLVEDSRLTYPEWSLPARFGGSAMNYSKQSNNGLPGVGGGPVSFTIRTNNPVGSSVASTLIWRNVVEFTITGVAGNTFGDGLFNQGWSDAPRAYSLTSCCNNVKIEINGQSTDFPYLDQVGHVLRRFNPRAAMYKSANFCPWYPDSGCTRYFDVLNTNRNPLGSGGVGDFDFTRGCYQKVLYTNGVAGGTAQNSGKIVLETFEPVNISPFIYDMQGKGIPYIETLGLTFYTSNLYRALSRAAGNTGNGVIAAITSANVSAEIKTSELYYQQINLPLWAREIAPVVKFPYYKIRSQSFGASTVTFGVPAMGPATPPAGSNVTSLIVNYDCIPSRFYVFVQPPQNQLTMQDADFTFMYCGGLQVTWGNNTYMASVTPQQLYTSAVDCGYAFPWENFGGSYMIGTGANGTQIPVGSSGSIICLRPGIDFPLEPGQVVGMGGQFSIQIQGNFHDQRAPPSAGGSGNGVGNMWIVAVLPGVFTISSDGTAQFSTGVINKNDVTAAMDKETGDIVESRDIYESFGSGMFDSLKSSLPLLKRIGRYAHAGLSAAKDAGLLGEGVMSGGSTMSGGAASMYGGARLTAADLAARRR